MKLVFFFLFAHFPHSKRFKVLLQAYSALREQTVQAGLKVFETFIFLSFFFFENTFLNFII